jgi:hypothetical protein
VLSTTSTVRLNTDVQSTVRSATALLEEDVVSSPAGDRLSSTCRLEMVVVLGRNCKDIAVLDGNEDNGSDVLIQACDASGSRSSRIILVIKQGPQDTFILCSIM